MSSKIPKMSIKIETKNRVINSFGSISIWWLSKKVNKIIERYIDSPPAKGISPVCIFLNPSGLSISLNLLAMRQPTKQEKKVAPTTKVILITMDVISIKPLFTKGVLAQIT